MGGPVSEMNERTCEFGYRHLSASLNVNSGIDLNVVSPWATFSVSRVTLLGLQPWVPINLRGLGYKGGALKLLASGLRLRKRH
jgi:hypothetical protein